MKRMIGSLVLLTAVGGWMAMAARADWGGNSDHFGRSASPPTVPGVRGPWGEPVVMAAPYSADPPGAAAARAMMGQSLPLNMVQPGGMPMGGPSPITLAGASCPPGGGAITPPGVPFGPGMPGSGGFPQGAVAAVGALTGGVPNRFATQRTEVRFVSPAGMKLAWYAPTPNAPNGFSSNQLEVPGRYNFVQAAVYRLKLSNIPGRPNLELYPTLEVVPSGAKTNPFLAHSAVPVAFTEEDFDQVAAGNFVVKVVYLPDPQFQDLATTGTEEVVSSRLEPGVDPIAEAFRRGSILLIVRLGNIDLEAPNTPAMDSPNPYPPRPVLPAPGMGMGMGMGMPHPGPMVPYGSIGSGRPYMMGPNGPMIPNDPGMMGPNGPVMGPSGQAMMGPNGQPTLPTTLPNPGATGPATGLTRPVVPGTNPGQPAVPPFVPPVTAPTTMLPGTSEIQQASFPGGPNAFTEGDQQTPNGSAQSSSPLRRLFVSGKLEDKK